jgi:hypothetical protein
MKSNRPNDSHRQNPNLSSETIADRSSCQYKNCAKTTKKPSQVLSGSLCLTVDGQFSVKFNSGAELHSSLPTCGQVTTCVKTTWPNWAGSTIEMCMDCLLWLRLFMCLPKVFSLSRIVISTRIIIRRMITSLWRGILRSSWRSWSDFRRKVLDFYMGFCHFCPFCRFFEKIFLGKLQKLQF